MDYVKLKNYAKKNEIENKLNIRVTKPIILFTQHPIPMENENIKNNFAKILNAIKRLSKLLYGCENDIKMKNNQDETFQDFEICIETTGVLSGIEIFRKSIQIIKKKLNFIGINLEKIPN